MNPLREVDALIQAGRFRTALQELNGLTVRPADRLRLSVTHAQLLERTGRYHQSEIICERLLQTHGLPPAVQSACHLTLGLIRLDASEPRAGLVHLQKAVSLAKIAKDPFQTFWSQLRLTLAVADQSGCGSAASLLAQTRSSSLRLGDPQASAALHVFVGEMEAKRGLLQNAYRHTMMGLRLLGDAPNLWIEARAEITLVALAIMRSSIDEGMRHAEHALRLADLSGCAGLKRACLGNLGNLYYLSGRFSEAAESLESGYAALPEVGEKSNGTWESIARIRLRENRASDAAVCLARLEESIKSPSDWLLYANRHSRLTRAELLCRLGLHDEAAEQVELALRLASDAGDHRLRVLGVLMKADLLIHRGRFQEAEEALVEVGAEIRCASPEIQAQFEGILASGLARTTDLSGAQQHRDRAKRIFTGLRNTPGLLDLDRSWTEALGTPGMATLEGTARGPFLTGGSHVADVVIQNLATLLMHAGRPELIATGVVALLADSASFAAASARSRNHDGSVDILASFAHSDAAALGNTGERTISVGVARDRSFDVVVRPVPGIEPMATLNAVAKVVETIHDLERAQVEREEQQTLWPVEDMSLDDGDAVASGKMRELLGFARKVATTNVGVLITGGIDPQSAPSDRGSALGTAVSPGRWLDRTAERPPLESAA